MARGGTNKSGTTDTTTNGGFEAKLWAAADALRNNMDAAEYKHVVLGLIFLKYISDAFEAKHAELAAQTAQGADPEDPDEYRAMNIFWVPPEARWAYLKSMAPQPTIGQLVDDAMSAIERDNVSLKGQRAIAHILGTLDDKIELSRRMNEALEAMAQALFKSWFVDFNTVRAKGRISEIPTDLSTLFPESLCAENTPAGWQNGILLDLCELKRGYDLPTAQRAPGSYPIISSSGVSGNHAVPMAKGPGVVTGRYGTIGEVFFINRAYWPLNTALY